MIKITAAALLGGTLIALYNEALTGWWYGIALACLGLLGWRPARVACGIFLLAVVLANSRARSALDARLTAPLDAVAYGCVSSPVVIDADALRFEFAIERLASQQRVLKAQLAIYDAARVPRPGECWTWRVRLRPPRGLLNVHGFDYEKYAFVRGIGARGYVLAPRTAWRDVERPLGYRLLRARLALAARVRFAAGEGPHTGLYEALSVGLRGGLSAPQWRVLTATGSGHLIAISGLHVGLLAGFGYLLTRWMPPGRAGAHRLMDAAAVTALVFALIYAALAGFALPTVRALIMLSVFALATLSRRRYARFDVLAAALAIVVLLDPLAVLGLSFWMSFGAVAALLALTGPRLPAVAVPLSVFVALAPLLATATGRLAILTPLANLVAVPIFSFAIIPLTLIGALCSVLHAPLAAAIFGLLETLLTPLWWWLATLASVEWGVLPVPVRPVWMAALAAMGVLALALPAISARFLGIALCLPLLFARNEWPAHGTFRLHVLDVGQGLATIVQTRTELLVYDAGDRWPRSDAGERVLRPYLNALGVADLHTLVISHADRDHRGGAASLIAGRDVGRVYAGESLVLAGHIVRRCRAGIAWQVDGVHFEFLHPDQPDIWTGNNASCVLKVGAGRDSALLTGDIERLAELAMLHRSLDLAAGVVVGQHHGSRTSSSPAFIATSQPRYVVFSAGWHNQWGLPIADIVRRWQAQDAIVFDTATAGGLVFDMDAAAAVAPRRARHDRPARWRFALAGDAQTPPQ